MPDPMDRAVVMEANATVAQEHKEAQDQSNTSIAQLAETHVKQRQLLEDYHVDQRKDDAERRWDERQDQQSMLRKAQAEEVEKQRGAEMRQRERDVAAQAVAEQRAAEERQAKEESTKQDTVLREWTTEFRSSPVATGSPVMPESSIALTQVESFPTNASLTSCVAKAAGRPTKEVSHIQAEVLMVPPDPQKQADEDNLQQIEQRIELEIDRVSALNVFQAQEARSQRLAAAKRAARREMGSEHAWAARKAEELEEKLQTAIHKIAGRQAAAEQAATATEAARSSGRPVRKPRGALTKEDVRELVDRLSAPKEVP